MLRFCCFLTICFFNVVVPSFSVEDEMYYSTTWRRLDNYRKNQFYGNKSDITNVLSSNNALTSPFMSLMKRFVLQRNIYLLNGTNFFKWNFPTVINQFLRSKVKNKFFVYANEEDRNPEKYLADWYRKYEFLKIETAVITIGNTGSGKSTTIASLQGAKLIETRLGKIELDPSEDKRLYPSIGNTVFSETIYPDFFKSKNTNLTFVDYPGVFDNRGETFNIIRNSTLECTVKSIDNPKLMVVIGFDELTSGRGKGFMDLVSHFSPLLQYSTFDSILWVITKTPHQYEKEDVLDLMRDLGNVPSGLVSSILDKLGASNDVKRKWMEKKKSLAESVKQIFDDPNSSPNNEEEKNFVSEAERLEHIKEIIHSIDEENLIIFDPLKEEKRSILLTKLENLPEISNDKFQFNRENQNEFKKFSNKAIQHSFFAKIERDKLQREISSLKSDIEFNKRKIDQKDKELKNLIKEEIKRKQILLQELSSKKDKLIFNKKVLNENGSETCIYEELFNEKRRWLSFNWTIKDFKYSGSPIKRFERSHDEHGQFRYWNLQNTKDKGFLEARYAGGLGQDSWVQIKLYGIFNQQQHIGKLIESLEQEQKSYEKLIEGLKFKIENLNSDLENPEKLTKSKLQNEIYNAEKEKNEKEEKLNSIKKNIEEKKYFYKSIDYIRGRLGIRNEFDLRFQEFLDTI